MPLPFADASTCSGPDIQETLAKQKEHLDDRGRCLLVLFIMGSMLVAALVGLVVQHIAWRWRESMDMGRIVHSHRPGVCRRVEGPVKGSEDIQLIRSDGIAFITSGLLYLQPHRNANFEGKIFLYDFNEVVGDHLNATELPIVGESFDKENFHPHGLTHWIIGDTIRLYVINHSKEMKHSVEVFDYDPSVPALFHNRSIRHPTLVRPNNLAAVGPDQFIFSNDGVFQSDYGSAFEVLTGYNGGTVYYWDGKDSHRLLSGMGGPNGLAYDYKWNKLFVAELHKKVINAYEVGKNKKSLNLLSSISVNSGCDNLFIDSDHSVYTACHPVLYELAKSIADCDGPTTSPSQVLRLKYDSDYKKAVISEPYANDGNEHSASSVAVLYNNQMLIGSICKGLLHCEIPDPSVLNFHSAL